MEAKVLRRPVPTVSIVVAHPDGTFSQAGTGETLSQDDIDRATDAGTSVVMVELVAAGGDDLPGLR